MAMEFVWWSLGFGLVAAALLRLSGFGGVRAVAGGAPAAEGERVTCDDRQVLAAIRAREEEFLRAEQDAERRCEQARAAAAKIRRARAVVEETGLAVAVPNLWQRLRLGWPCPQGAAELSGAFRDLVHLYGPAGSESLSWCWNGVTYALTCADPLDNPVLSLKVAGQDVLVMHCGWRADDPARYEFEDIDTLRTGPWMAELIRMDGLLDRAAGAAYDRFHDQLHFEQAARIELGSFG